MKKAPACTKADLKTLMEYVVLSSTCITEYQDATLLCLLWYLFGRASDMTLLLKGNISQCSEHVLFLRLVRMKTSEEQGLSLFPDECFLTCPITALSIALALKRVPNALLFEHLPGISLGGAVWEVLLNLDRQFPSWICWMKMLRTMLTTKATLLVPVHLRHESSQEFTTISKY